MATEDTTMELLEERRDAAYDRRNLARYAMWSRVITEVTNLRAVAAAAARVYHDHSDDDAWAALFDALSSTDFLDEAIKNEEV